MQKGDKKAAVKLFDYFSPLFYRFFLSRTTSHSISQDLTQDVFLRVISKIEQYDKKVGTFSNWIWQIAKNQLIDHYRQKKELKISEISQESFAFSSKSDLEAKIEIEYVMRVAKKILTEKELELLQYYYFADLAYKDIKSITGKSEGSLRVSLYRINKKIKDFFKQNEKNT